MRPFRFLGIIASAAVVAAAVVSSAGAAQATGSCPTGKSAVSNVSYKITDPDGTVRLVSALRGNTKSGDAIEASFNVPALPAGCDSVQLSLASYRAPTAPPFTLPDAQQQVLFNSSTGTFAPGAHTLAATVPPASASGGAISIGPAGMQGGLVAHPGDMLATGYGLMVPGPHSAATFTVHNPRVDFPFRCTNGGAAVGSFAVNMADAVLQVKGGSSGWYPTGSSVDPAGYQGSIVVPDVCSGGPVLLDYSGSFGARFTATIWTLNDTTDKVTMRFHYVDPSAAGRANVNCSDPAQNPSPGVSSCDGTLSATNHNRAVYSPHYQVDFVSGAVQAIPQYRLSGVTIAADAE